MSELYKKREDRIALALKTYNKNFYKSTATCAREFEISSCFFQQRFKIDRFKFIRVFNHIILSVPQKLSLTKFVVFLNKIEISVNVTLGSRFGQNEMSDPVRTTLQCRVGAELYVRP
jgi:hypothetical protein